ncbi:hypothetical protein ARGLB_037_01130 [Arthrobacter globiformis NBRC 12137]|uniref:Uncharacterized protein n=1 Tax=Arthrobacter globiformis (strain ATCC 8010 / DSM 20124 / JCM 1332 / NBRC 12137 / NCIMB 8907 / NRRL B-2979 / 168) TaxID=1077972 RepID=H0QK22_ARTG1|nr:hypothetical protein ARGLB_037_01130 [Arthrobacter globiformis NBRC 12137]
MKPDLPAAVPDRDDAAVRAAAQGFGCLDVQNQARPGRRDRADVDTVDTKITGRGTSAQPSDPTGHTALTKTDNNHRTPCPREPQPSQTLMKNRG